MAGLIPERTVREIVDRTDMAQIVGEVVELRRAGSSLKGLCPFHSEKTPSFHINPGLKLYHCKGCGAGGDLVKFVRETRGLSFVEAVEFLADRSGVTIEREHLSPAQQRKLAEERSQRGRMLALNQAAQQFFRSRIDRPEGQAAREYAERRGLGQSIAMHFGLGAAGSGWTDLCDHLHRQGFADQDIVAMGLGVPRSNAGSGSGGGLYDRFRSRLMFPIFNTAGDLVGFGGRVVGEQDKEVAKYMNSPETTLPTEPEGSRFHHFYKKGAVVFGLWQARDAIRKQGLAIVVEGNLDVMTLHQAGLDNTVCAMGTALTEQQVKEIKRFTDRVALVFDGDNAGRKAAMKAVPLCVGAGLEGVFVHLPEGEDPDSYVRHYGAEALRELILAAPPMLLRYIDGLVAECDGSPQAKSRVLQKAGPLLAALADPIARDIATDHLRQRLFATADRATVQRYLSQVLPAQAMVTQEDPPPPDATWGEPEIPLPEQHLAEVLLWYPALAREPEHAGLPDLVRHPGMRLALRDLVAHVRDVEADVTTVAAWARTLPDGRARRLLLHLLMEAPRVPAEQARGEVARLAAMLQVRDLKDQVERIRQELLRPGQALDRQRALSQEMQRLMKDMDAMTRPGRHP